MYHIEQVLRDALEQQIKQQKKEQRGGSKRGSIPPSVQAAELLSENQSIVSKNKFMGKTLDRDCD